MAEVGWARTRIALLWLTSLALLGVAIFDSDEVGPSAPARVLIDPDDDSRLRIVQVSDAEVMPGDAIVIVVDGIDATQPIEAVVQRRPAVIIARHDPELVVRIPDDTPTGKASIRVVQGARRSKTYDLLVRQVRLGKAVRNMLGGLALLLIGLQALAKGLRKLAGHDLRRYLTGVTRGTTRALGSGMLLGGTIQLTTSAGALVLNLAESELVAPASVFVILLGAQLGASVTGALLPFAISRASLLIIVAGVVWRGLARARRGQAIGRALIGAGLVLYGLHVLETGVAPFVAHPAMLPFVRFLEAGSPASIAACTLLGTLLAALLQGPGPLFGLVLGLLQVSGALGLPNALAMLAGAPLGAALSTTLVAWPWSPSTRPITWAYLRFGAVATVFLALTSGLWASLVARLGSGAALAASIGERALYPHAHAPLVIGFLAGQVLVTAVAVVLVPRLVRRGPAAPRRARTETAAPMSLVPAWQDALRFVPVLVQRGNRNLAGEAEQRLAQAARRLESELSEGDPAARPSLAAAVHLTRALGELMRVADAGVERGVVLDASEQAALLAVHGLVSEGVATLHDALTLGQVDLEAARAREIRLNAREAEVRRALARAAGAPEGLVLLGELIDAYEGVGNRVWRVLEAASHDIDDPED